MIGLDQNKVIVPLSLEELSSVFDPISLKVINYFLRKSIFSQPEKLPNQPDLPIHIPKEHIEQWICQSIGSIPVGAGSYAVDVISKSKVWGADIKMLSCKVDSDSGKLKNSDSGETSLAQKFGDDNFGNGNTLDDLFANKEYQVIWNNWMKILKKKYRKVNEDFGVSNIYYFFILRAELDFHLCGMKLLLNNLNHTKVNYERSTNDSVWIKNYIEDRFGHVKVYKAKKRLELRLKPKYWVENNFVITFNTNFNQFEVDIRELILKNKIHLHVEKNLLPLLKEFTNDKT
jgi:hypothetical protein